MTNRFQFDEGTGINLPSTIAQIIGFILAPSGPEILLLRFGELHIHHIGLHCYSSLFTGGRVAEKWKIQVLKVDPRGDGFLHCRQGRVY